MWRLKNLRGMADSQFFSKYFRTLSENNLGISTAGSRVDWLSQQCNKGKMYSPLLSVKPKRVFSLQNFRVLFYDDALDLSWICTCVNTKINVMLSRSIAMLIDCIWYCFLLEFSKPQILWCCLSCMFFDGSYKLNPELFLEASKQLNLIFFLNRNK